MIELHVDKLVGGNIVITTSGGGNISGHPETIITLLDDSIKRYNISGTLDASIMNDLDNFDSCGGSLIKAVDIGTSVNLIDSQAFYNCNSLRSVTIPDSVGYIGYEAFYGCSGLTSVTIPDSVDGIGDSAFAGCRELTSVTFEGKDKATVQGMTNYPFGLNSGTLI